MRAERPERLFEHYVHIPEAALGKEPRNIRSADRSKNFALRANGDRACNDGFLKRIPADAERLDEGSLFRFKRRLCSPRIRVCRAREPAGNQKISRVAVGNGPYLHTPPYSFDVLE
jgi:hypothetical protein